MIKIDRDEIILSTGRKIPTTGQVIGINRPFKSLEVLIAYDNSSNDITNHFTKAEKIELADYMIKLWKEYKEK